MKKWQFVADESNEKNSKFRCPFCETTVDAPENDEKFLPDKCPFCGSNMLYKRNYNKDRVTLRKFLGIVGNSLILTPYDCHVYIMEPDPFFDEVPKMIMFGKRDSLPSLEHLEAYMDYEVVKFNENRDYEEIIDQGLWLRKFSDNWD